MISKSAQGSKNATDWKTHHDSTGILNSQNINICQQKFESVPNFLRVTREDRWLGFHYSPSMMPNKTSVT